MIRKYCEIDKGNQVIKYDEELTVQKALLILVDCEIGWGAQIKECQPTVVEVTTTVLGQRELTRFEGTVEEMRTLHRAAAIAKYINAKNMAERNGVPFSKGEIAWVTQITQGNPRLIEMGGAMFASMGRPKVIYTLLLAEDKEEADMYYKFTARDLYEMVVMKCINQESIEVLLA